MQIDCQSASPSGMISEFTLDSVAQWLSEYGMMMFEMALVPKSFRCRNPTIRLTPRWTRECAILGSRNSANR